MNDAKIKGNIEISISPYKDFTFTSDLCSVLSYGKAQLVYL